MTPPISGSLPRCVHCARTVADEEPGLWVAVPVRGQGRLELVCLPCAEALSREPEGFPAIARCTVCGTAFTPKRADTHVCRAACRQKAYRQRRLAA